MGRTWRAYHPGLPAERGATLALSAEEAHHIRRVLRLGVGDPVRVFDGAGAEWTGVIERASPAEVVLRLVEPLGQPVDPALPIELFQGWCRPERTDWIVQKATEIGVASIRLFRAERSDAARPSATRLERWQRIAVEACKQSGRRRVPAVEVIDELPAAGSDVLGLLPDPEPGRPALAELLAAGRPGPVALAIGPEGGFSAAELALAVERGWRAVSLGPRTLRAETAALVAAAIVLHQWCDLGRTRERPGAP